jgi:ferric-dicitrate binding protein FerR (iron transport regulator)
VAQIGQEPLAASVLEMAARWVSRLQAVDAEATLREQHRAWLAEDPAHAAAFARMLAIWELLDRAHVRYVRQDTEENGRSPGVAGPHESVR